MIQFSCYQILFNGKYQCVWFPPEKRDGGQLRAEQKIPQNLSFIVHNTFILCKSFGKIMLDELPCRNSHYLLNIVNTHFSQIIKYPYRLHTWQTSTTQ